MKMETRGVSIHIQDGAIAIRDGDSAETIRADEVVRVVRVEFGGDFAGPSKSCFWIFDLGDSAVVTPDCPPSLRRDVLPELSPTRAETKYGETGMAAYERIAASAVKPNAAETEAILRGAKYLKAGGAVLFVGGMALTAYDIYEAPEGQRVEVAKREGVGMAGGFVGSNVAVGVCFLLGMTGVGLVVVGLVAGVAGAYAAEQVYYAHADHPAVKQLQQQGETHIWQFWTWFGD